MKKNLVSILALAALVTLAGCGDKTSTDTAKGSDNPTTDKTSTSATDSIVVNSVTITNSEGSALTDDDLIVLDGTSVTLKASVSASKTGLKVSWSSSNAEVAKVTNGVVRFLSVSETTDVTITATSKDDATKSASVTFHVQHSMIDLSSSRATDLDTSEFLSDGKISTGVGDTALVYADVYDTKWYVQADITYTAFSESDNYPKFGIMSGNKAGIWNQTTESDICQNNFFYLDTTNPNSSSSWSNFNTVTSNSTYTDWSWGTQLGGFNYTYKMGETLTLGLLRDGQDYYEFVTKQNEDGTDGELVCMKHVVDTLIPADVKTYAWVGGWATAAEVSNFKSLTGDAVDAMYKDPADLTVTGDGTTLYLGETYQLNVSADFINFNSKKLTYTSSDPTVAEVSDTGLVTAKNKAGSADITITYGTTITKTIKINVTDDVNFRVEIDGKMDDGIWSDKVKTNFYRLNLQGTGEYIDFYGAMNSRGIYLFAKAHVNNMKNGETHKDWWENDNFEMKFMDTTTGSIINSANPDKSDGQVWISANKTSNFEGYYVSDTVLNDETSKYDIVYETFTSFDRLNKDVDAGTYNMNTPLAVCFGSNPASGWKNSDFWGKASAALRVTKDGFMHADGKYCSDGDHEYGDWVITKASNCTEDGVKTKTCKYCAHEETEAIAKNPDVHVYDYDNATVKTASTCTTHGTGEAECTVCHTKKDVELALNPTNHEETYDSDKGIYACCGETIKVGETKSADVDIWNLNVSRLVMDGTSNFEVEYDIHNDENSSKDGAASNWVADLSSASKKEDGSYGEWANGGMTITADWNAWGANTNVHEANDNSNMPGDWFNQGYMLWFGNMDIHLNVKFVDGVFEINGVYTFLGDGAGNSMKVHYTSTAFTTKDYMVLNFGCQNSKITYKSVKVVSGTLIAHTTK